MRQRTEREEAQRKEYEKQQVKMKRPKFIAKV